MLRRKPHDPNVNVGLELLNSNDVFYSGTNTNHVPTEIGKPKLKKTQHHR